MSFLIWGGGGRLMDQLALYLQTTYLTQKLSQARCRGKKKTLPHPLGMKKRVRLVYCLFLSNLSVRVSFRRCASQHEACILQTVGQLVISLAEAQGQQAPWKACPLSTSLQQSKMTKELEIHESWPQALTPMFSFQSSQQLPALLVGTDLEFQPGPVMREEVIPGFTELVTARSNLCRALGERKQNTEPCPAFPCYHTMRKPAHLHGATKKRRTFYINGPWIRP